MADWFGASWATIGFVVTGTVAAYVTLLLGVRLAGRRTVSELSAFDVVVTVALGSMLASTAVSRDPSYLQGVVAMATLLLLQVVVAALRQRSGFVRRLVDIAPERVVHDGAIDLPSGPSSSQLSEDELRSLLREKGYFDTDGLAEVILEPGGDISIRTVTPHGGDGP